MELGQSWHFWQVKNNGCSRTQICTDSVENSTQGKRNQYLEIIIEFCN